eukprot:scaffold74158_cov59-Phaeocystis_antarctica.AAC.1
MNRPATNLSLTRRRRLCERAVYHVPHDEGRRRRRRRLGRGGLADALLGRGARASAAATKDVEGPPHPLQVEHAAWRIAWPCARCAVVRGLVGQVERRGGGIALALGRDEAAAAGAALDHVVAPGYLDVTGRHWRGGGHRRRWRRRRQRWWRRRGELADALLGRGARARAAATVDVEGAGPEEDAAWRRGRACVPCAVVRGLLGQVERRGGGLALARGGDEGAAAGAALDHVVAPGDLD